MEVYKSCVMYGRQLTPIGKRLTADIISPVNPTRNDGWMGIVCDRGTNIILGATILTTDPTKKDDFIVEAGTTGKLARARVCELIVKPSP